MSETPQQPYPPAGTPNAYPPPPPGAPGAYPPPPPSGAPGQYGQPYPPQTPPPPVAPTLPPGYVDPNAAYGGPAQQPPKRRPGWIIGVVVAVVAGCALFLCLALVIGGVLGSGGKDKAAVAVAEEHFKAAESAVASATAAIAGIDSSDSGTSGVSEAVDSAVKSLRVGRDEIAAARASIEQLKDSTGKRDYLESLDSATRALDGLEDYLAYVDDASGMLALAKDARKAERAAVDDLNAAVDAGNANKYSKMHSRGRDAWNGFVKAGDLYREAHKVDKTAGFDKAAEWVALRRKQASVVIVMSNDGKAGRIRSYNKGVSKLKKLDKQLEKIGQPAILKDEDWIQTRLADLMKRIEDSAKAADTARQRALEQLN